MHRLNEQKLINMHANTPFANHHVPAQYNAIKLVFKKDLLQRGGHAYRDFPLLPHSLPYAVFRQKIFVIKKSL